LIQAQAAELNLAPAEPNWDHTSPAGASQSLAAMESQASREIRKLLDAVLELEYTLIPHGLHIVGEPSPPEARVDMLMSMAEASHGLVLDRKAVAALVHGETPAEAAARNFERHEQLVEIFEKLRDANQMLLVETEVEGILKALDARFIRPAPGGDVLRTPEVLPTGRNLHGFDPFKIPSAYAVRDGARQAQRLLDRYQSDGHPLPESIAMVLWGTDNLKTEGSPIAQALHLMGAAPRLDSYGRVAGAMLIPLAELGRPRIDVVITLSGIFRDLMPLQIKMLAEAAYLCATAEEPTESNFIRKHALAYQAEHGCSLEEASLRVYGNAEGAYGSNVNSLIENSRWDEEDELAETYSRRKGFAYGRAGRPIKQPALLQSVLKDVQLTYQNLDSVELGVTTVDNYFDTLGGITGAVKRARGGDAPPVYIGDQTKGEGAVRTLSEQLLLRLEPGCSIRSGMRECSSMATRACDRSRFTSPTPWAGRQRRARCSPGSISS
jgi:magnesium chelatase subunit H